MSSDPPTEPYGTSDTHYQTKLEMLHHTICNRITRIEDHMTGHAMLSEYEQRFIKIETDLLNSLLEFADLVGVKPKIGA